MTWWLGCWWSGVYYRWGYQMSDEEGIGVSIQTDLYPMIVSLRVESGLLEHGTVPTTMKMPDHGETATRTVRRLIVELPPTTLSLSISCNDVHSLISLPRDRYDY